MTETPNTHPDFDAAEPNWDEHQTAAYLKLSVSTLQKKRLNGGGPPFLKLGRAVRYRPSKVRAYAAAAERASTSDAA